MSAVQGPLRRLILTVVKMGDKNKGTLLGTPNREPQEYSRNMMEYKDPGRYIPSIYLLYSWGSRFGVPSRVPLKKSACKRTNRLTLPRLKKLSAR